MNKQWLENFLLPQVSKIFNRNVKLYKKAQRLLQWREVEGETVVVDEL
jgi:hypothetical protein